MPCSEYSTELSPNTGGKLIISYEGGEIYSREIEPVDKEETHGFSDSFYDVFDNSYTVNISIADYVLDISVEQGTSGIRADFQDVICNGMSISYYEEEYFEDTSIEQNVLDTDTKSLDIPYAEPKNFFAIKLSRQDETHKDIEKLVDFYKARNTSEVFVINDLSHHQKLITLNDIVFIVAGGDKGANKFDYHLGLYGVARVVKEAYEVNKQHYSIQVQFIYFFTKVLSREELGKYPETIGIPFIGLMKKGEKTQPVYTIKAEEAKIIILAAGTITNMPKEQLSSLFPWIKDESKAIATKNSKLIIDTHPAGLNVIDIAKVFANYLVHYNSKHTSTLIGIFGQWGRGKTYFYDRMREYIQNPNTNKDKTFYFCTFQPWKYQKQASAWAYLYQQIFESYLKKDIDVEQLESETRFFKKTFYKAYIFIDKIKKIALLNIKRLGYWKSVYPIISILVIGYWTFFLTFEEKFSLFNSLIGILGISGIIILFKSYSFYMKSKDAAQNLINNYGKARDYSNYLGFQNEIETELCYLLETYIDKDSERLILFVDDLDRCNENMIIDIIDGLRLVLDNEKINSRLTIITAVDERILEKSIKHKYINKEDSCDIGTKEYIEKFFLMAIKLNQLNNTDIEEIVDLYAKKINSLSGGPRKVDEDMSLELIAKDGKTSRKFVKIPNGPDNMTLLQDERHMFSDKVKIVQLNGKGVIEGQKLQALNKDEIISIKKMLKDKELLTPRKINIIIHRYLIYKSLIFVFFNSVQYTKFNERMLIEFVINSQDKEKLKEYIKHYQNNPEYEIPIPLEDFPTDKINRKDYITLIKFAEMVSPF